MVVFPGRGRPVFGVDSHHGNLGGVADSEHGDFDHRHLTCLLGLVHAELDLPQPDDGLCGDVRQEGS